MGEDEPDARRRHPGGEARRGRGGRGPRGRQRDRRRLWQSQDVGASGAGPRHGLRRLLHPQHHPGDVGGGILHPLLPGEGSMLRGSGGCAAEERVVAEVNQTLFQWIGGLDRRRSPI